MVEGSIPSVGAPKKFFLKKLKEKLIKKGIMQYTLILRNYTKNKNDTIEMEEKDTEQERKIQLNYNINLTATTVI